MPIYVFEFDFSANYKAMSALNVEKTSLSNLEQRLSRLLLLAFDRLESTNLSITHETIGYLLGVRREVLPNLLISSN